jgi:hypothetical protein
VTFNENIFKEQRKMSKKLLEEKTIRQFMKLANIEASVRDNFLSDAKEKGPLKEERDYSLEEEELEETAYWGDVDEAEEDVDVDVGVEDVEVGGEATMELDIDEEDAHAIIRFADALKKSMGVEGAEGAEDIEAEPAEAEPEVEFEPEAGEEEEEEVVEKCDPPCEEGETCIGGECMPEEEEEEEGEAEVAAELTERKTDDVVKEIAARVAARLLKKKK